MRKKEATLPTIIGLVVTIAGLITGLWLVRSEVGKNAQAASGETPGLVKITNLTDSGFVVSWITDTQAAGFIQYSETPNGTETVVSDDRDQQSGTVNRFRTHFVTVRNLKPETNYRFKIGSGGSVFDQQGQPYGVATGIKINTTPNADVAYGQVMSAAGQPAEGALVYLQMTGGTIQASLVKASGSWVIPLSMIRTADLKNYLAYDKQAAPITIQVADGMGGESTIVTKSGDVAPVAVITIGQTISNDTGGVVKILTPQTGEKVNSNRPEIMGKAPAGVTVTIEVHSNQVVSGSVVTDPNGNFSYTVPSDLAPGLHTITVTALINGVAQQVTKTFTVYAAGDSTLPAFSATPSATVTPKLKPTATPIPAPTTRPAATPIPTIVPTAVPPGVTIIPTPTLKPTATPKPTLVPTVIPTPATTSGLPVTGAVDWTWWILGMGVILVGAGSYGYLKK